LSHSSIECRRGRERIRQQKTRSGPGAARRATAVPSAHDRCRAAALFNRGLLSELGLGRPESPMCDTVFVGDPVVAIGKWCFGRSIWMFGCEDAAS